MPWDYGRIVRGYLKRHTRLLDIDTGGGEILLSFRILMNIQAQQKVIPLMWICVNRYYCPLELIFGKLAM